MSVLHCLQWFISSHSIVSAVALLMFSFGLLFRLMRV